MTCLNIFDVIFVTIYGALDPIYSFVSLWTAISHRRQHHHQLANRQKMRLLLVVSSRHNKRRKLSPRSQLQEENLAERSVAGEDESQAQEKDLMM